MSRIDLEWLMPLRSEFYGAIHFRRDSMILSMVNNHCPCIFLDKHVAELSVQAHHSCPYFYVVITHRDVIMGKT
jgi:hypothetical protein